MMSDASATAIAALDTIKNRASRTKAAANSFPLPAAAKLYRHRLLGFLVKARHVRSPFGNSGNEAGKQAFAK